MSNFTYVTVHCDHADCEKEVTQTSYEGGLNITTVRRAALDQGWQVNGQVAYCPTHRPTRLKFHAFVPGAGYSKDWCNAVTGKGRSCWKSPTAYIHTGGQP